MPHHRGRGARPQEGRSDRDAKKDIFPWRNRPAFVFDALHQQTVKLLRDGLLPSFTSPSFTASITHNINEMSDLFEEFEHLGLTLLPLPFAQLNRLVMIAFLALLPFAAADSAGRLLVPFCLLANVVYFTLDSVAAEMETPFGKAISDVAFEKMRVAAESNPPPGCQLPGPLYLLDPGVAQAPTAGQAHGGAARHVPRQARAQL